MNARQRFSVGGIVVSILAGVVAALLVIGRESRLVDVLTMYFSGFAGGASLVSLVMKRSKQ